MKSFGLFLLLLFLNLGLFAQGTSEQLKLTFRDEVDLEPVSEVRVLFLFPGNEEIRISDARGEIFYPAEWDGETTRLNISSGDYEDQKTFLSEAEKLGYTLFLKPKTFYNDEVILTASKFAEDRKKVAQQVEVIKAKDIEFRNPQSSADLLQQSGAVFVQRSQMGGGSPNLRGFEANKVMIVIDGVRMNNAIYRGGHLQNVISLDPNMVERTEVMFGPGAVLYGSDALGGVMHFYTRDAALASGDKPLIRGNAFARFSTANLEKTAHADLNIGLKNIAFLTSVSVSDFDDLRAGANFHKDYPDFWARNWYVERINGIDSIVENSDPLKQRFSGYSQIDVMQKIYIQQPKAKLSHKINLQLSRSSDIPRYDRLTQFADNGDPRYYNWHYGPQKRFFASYRGTAFSPEGKGLYDQLRLTLSFQDIEESRINRRYRRDEEKSRIEKVQVYSLNLDASKKLKKNHQLNYGLEYSYNDVQSEAFATDITSNVISPLDTRYPDGGSFMSFAAVYLAHKWNLNDWLTLSDGIRLTSVQLQSTFEDKSFYPFLPDEISQNNLAPSGTIGLVANPGEWKIAVQGATGFRTPNVDDVGKIFDSSPGNVIVPNANIEPEYTYTGELTLGRKFGKWVYAEATGFYTYYDNALVVRDFTLEGQDSLLYEGVMSRIQANQNAREAFMTGFNVNAVVNLMDHLQLTSSLTWTYARDRVEDVPLDHIPPMFGKTALNYRIKRFQTELWAAYNGWKRLKDYSPSGEDNLVFATPDGTPAWWTLNLRTSYSVNQNLRIQAGLENILDTHYRNFASGISAPGRNLIVSLRANF